MIAMGEGLPRPSAAGSILSTQCAEPGAEMHLNPRLLVFGEDVGVKGGVHGATLDMQKHFGVEARLRYVAL